MACLSYEVQAGSALEYNCMLLMALKEQIAFCAISALRLPIAYCVTFSIFYCAHAEVIANFILF
jgi:hypothetical protein